MPRLTLLEQRDAVVLLRNLRMAGTAFHIGDGYFLTAEHNVASPQVTAHLYTAYGEGSADALLIWSDAENDVALLEARDLAYLPRIEVGCRTPEIGESIHVTGFPGARLMFTGWGRISGPVDGDGQVALDVTMQRGMSGSPILDEAGRAVGLLQLMWTQRFMTMSGPRQSVMDFGYMRPGDQLCDLLRENAQ